MPGPRDALERLARRETDLSAKRAELESRSGVMRLALQFYAALIVAWSLALAAHWIFFASPRWLVLLHTLAFVLTVGYWGAAMVMLRIVRRRLPEMFED
ncbi:MAG: hypothetical protein QOK28_2030 [Actinomycetota bacterium]|jgi:hypothetical protein